MNLLRKIKHKDAIVKFPKALKIKGEIYKIKFKKVIISDEGKPCYGITDLKKKIIYLESGLSEKDRMLIMVHEMFHVILCETHMSLDEDLEESIVEALSTAVLEKFHIRFKKK